MTAKIPCSTETLNDIWRLRARARLCVCVCVCVCVRARAPAWRWVGVVHNLEQLRFHPKKSYFNDRLVASVAQTGLNFFWVVRNTVVC